MSRSRLLGTLWLITLLGPWSGDALAKPPEGLPPRDGIGWGNDQADVFNPLLVSGRYAEYFRAADHCPSAGAAAGIRVLVTGFEDLAAKPNPSGIVVDTLGKATWWPSGLDRRLVGTRDSTLGSSTLVPTLTNPPQPGDSNARITSRVLEVDGTRFQLCLAVLPVAWDLAAAIAVTEMDTFRPAMVLLTGRSETNDISVASSAVNKMLENASDHVGNRAEGRILPYVGGDDTVRLVPDSLRDASSVTGVRSPACLVRELRCGGSPCATRLAIEPAGTYICNNLAYAVAFGAEGKRVCLASPAHPQRAHTDCSNAIFTLQLTDLSPEPVVRFVHVPKGLDVNAANVERLARMLVLMMANENPTRPLGLDCGV